MSYRSSLTVSVLRSSNYASFACFFVVLFMYILVGVLVNVWTQLQDKNPELYDKLKPNEGDPRRHSRFPSTFLTTSLHLTEVCVARQWAQCYHYSIFSQLMLIKLW